MEPYCFIPSLFMSKHIIFSGNNAWGMWNFRSILIKHFVDRDYRVSVTAPYDEVYFKKFEEIGCDTYDMPIDAKGINPVTDLRLILNYKRLFKRLRPDLSITYTIKPNIYASIAAESLGIKYLPVTTGLGYTFLAEGIVPKIARMLYKYAFRKAEQVWFLNKDDIATFKAAGLIADEKIVQLYGEGVDTAHFAPKPLPAEEQVFLLVGRMLKDKGVMEYVNAARMLKKKYPNVHFQLLGAVWLDNPAAIEEAEIRAWEKEGVVEYLGRTSDVRTYIERAMCVVLPSYREGVPCTLMEAASMARPLVATDVPGCHEVVVDGYNGYLCEVRNAEDLAIKMERIILMPQEERIAMGANGRQLMIDKFDVKHVIAQYETTFDNLGV